MRSVLLKFGLIFFFLCAFVAAHGQINPATNIRWPQPECANTQAFYIPGSNTCSPVSYSNLTWPQPSCADPAAFFSPGAGACATVTTTGGLPVNNPSYTGTLQGTLATINAILSNVNTQINVMAPPYNAKGDCVTNDTAAFNAAQTAALAYAVNGQGPAAMVLPKAPGGCYVVSDWYWKGVDLISLAPTGIGNGSPGNYGVALKGLPGYDIIHLPDPSTNVFTATGWPSGIVYGIQFLIDNSAPGVYSAHRWPGRWFDDGAMTAGSAVFTAPRAHMSCGDVGQAIQVGGAGPAGADLVTTIASVVPCWKPSTSAGLAGWQVVTLAAAASTTVSNAHSYISLLGLPVNTHIGPCGLAADLYDAQASHWTATVSGSYNYGKWIGVSFKHLASGYQNDPCAIYTQGSPLMYGWHVEDMGVFGTEYGIVQGSSELNSFQQSDAGDFEFWEHNLFLSPKYPWISYNGFSTKVLNTEWTAPAGVQVLELANIAFDAAAGQEWDLGMESPNSPTAYGHRFEGGEHTLHGDLTSHATGQIGYLDCTMCKLYGSLANTQINAFGVTVEGEDATTSSFQDNSGYGNQYKTIYNGGASPGGLPLNYWVSRLFYKGSNNLAGRFTGDFLEDGNPATPYTHDDLLIVPRDVVVNYTLGQPYATYFVSDSTAITGTALIITGASPHNQFKDLMQLNEVPGGPSSYIVGQNFPSTGGQFIFSARCPSGTSFTALVRAAGTYSQTFSCTSSYQTYTLPFNFVAGDVGQPIYFGGTATNTFYINWAALVPVSIPNSILVASLSTAAATTDVVTLAGMKSTGHCTLTPTNASAATNLATTYVSAKAANQITVTHTATAGMTFDVNCTMF